MLNLILVRRSSNRNNQHLTLNNTQRHSATLSDTQRHSAMTSLQISSQSAKTGHGGHRLAGLSLVRDLHSNDTKRVWMIPAWMSDGKDSRRDQFIHSIRRGKPYLNIGSLGANGKEYGKKFLNEVSVGDIVLLQNTGGYTDNRGRKISSGLCGIFVVSGETLRGFRGGEGFYDARFVGDRSREARWCCEHMIPLKMHQGTMVRIEDPVKWSSLPVYWTRTPVEKKISVSDIQQIASHFR
jgi:hypothetical protein